MDAQTMTFPERVADAAVHLVGVLASVVGVSAMMVAVGFRGEALEFAAAAIFGVGLLASFSLSACYNIISVGEWREALRLADHIAIFLLIACAYTPIALVSVGGVAGAGLMVFVWGVAGVGAALVLGRRGQPPVLLYLLLGWGPLFLGHRLLEGLSDAALALLLTCGVVYSVGVVFFRWESLPYHNAIWHVFVLAASACLYAAILIELVR